MDSNIDVSERVSTGGFKTRIFAFATLVTLVSGIGYVGREAYRAFTDSFVAPIILSPDNDMVVQNKVKMSELYVERARTEAEIEGVEGDLAACDKAIARLDDLQRTIESALAWTKKVNAGQAFASAADLAALSRQKSVIAGMLEKQDDFSAAARANMEAGFISHTDYAKEVQTQNQLQIALIENERAHLQTEMQMKQIMLGQKALAGGGTAPMPEMVFREDQLVRVELELIKLESEKRTKIAERRLVKGKLAKIDELSAQLKSRPFFRAVEKSMDVAFVPYTQIDGMHEGARVYDCVWALFNCKHVGSVAEIVPGEVILPDPWGTQTRGQYAVLELREHESAKSKTLRVRLDAAARAPKAAAQPMAVK